jgi:cytochrome c oxidase subunit IV
MKKSGFLICMLGSVAAVLFPPYKLMGLGELRWAFILDSIIAAFGKNIPVYEHLDINTLLLEIAVINAIGIALMLFGRR